jgi:CubicO group peptidase (beta-lactamase class C family)
MMRLIVVLICSTLFSFGIAQSPQDQLIMARYKAKTLCSCIFIGGRQEADVNAKELALLQAIPAKVDREMQEVSIDLPNLAIKAIYRENLGCNVITGLDEASIRKHPPKRKSAGPILRPNIPWPAGDKLMGGQPKGVDHQAIGKVLDEAFSEKDPKIPVLTRAVILVYKDKIIAERYAHGLEKDVPHIGWSMTKSITSAMVGILVGEGKLKVNAPAPIAEWQQDARAKITLENLLHMSSGLQWDEAYNGATDVGLMLFDVPNGGAMAAAKTLDHKPGEKWYYSSGTTNIIQNIMRDKLGDQAYWSFPYEKLFHKIGMNSALLETDPSGTFVGSSLSWATARDWARFGLLYLHDGVWLGERVLPEGWVKYTTTPAPTAPKGRYGAQFWLNAGNKDGVPYPGLPEDAFSCRGFEGQFVMVVPSKDLVVVRLGMTPVDKGFDIDQFTANIIKSLP